ncbi:LytR C-terminal domain-containing protein [Longimicrobium sp.]|uniref:LytR C-terminal domain-containing protein n=1 Tax=Longimicrobium sp. TaxID=2029185 RepID=UPI002BAE3E01|nr:LytR C-terminal domain-containing protein [Longimicrobium sp.]HSU16501.1 LytR C-terminal domain-containing protein [Longimicrobium sp.]
MPRSKPKRGSGAQPARGGRAQTVGIFATLAAVAVLLGSVGWGVREYLRGPRAADPAAAADSARGPAARAPAGRVRVEVLNATTTHGLARQATDVLRDHGFDVVQTGNAGRGTRPDSSVVIDRVGRLDMARQVADALGIHRVQAQRNANLILDVTVVLGRDWRAPAAPQPAR